MSQIVTNADFKVGVKNLVDLVASTMGPAGHNVIVTGGESSAVFRDGAQVVRAYMPSDSVQRNAVIRLRDASEASLRFAGDSTSTTAVFLGSLYLAIENAIENAGVPIQRRLVTNRVETILKAMEGHVEANAIRVTHKNGKINRELLTKVATVAANNNAEIGGLVADLIIQLGHSGGVKIEYSKTGKIETAVNSGYVFNGGLVTPQYLPPGERQLSVDNPYIVLVNDTVASQNDIIKIMSGFNQNSFLKNEGRWCILICAELTGVALATAIARQHADAQGRPTGLMMPVLAIAPPKDINPKMFFEEMSAVTGARVVSKEDGHPLHKFEWSRDAGSAVNLVTSLSSTSVQYTDEVKTGVINVQKLIERLEKDKEAAEKDHVDGFKARINRLTGSVGTIKIPGNTQGEVFMNKEVIEDSYLACQTALQHGVLPGCGRGLWNAYMAEGTDSDTIEYAIADNCIQGAILATIGAVVKNAGGDDILVDQMVGEYTKAIDNNDFQKTFVVNDLFMLHAQELVRQNTVDTPVKKGLFGSAPTPKILSLVATTFEDGILADNFKDAVSAGVLDSAGGIIAALRNTRSEIALWVMTQNIIKE